MKRREFITLLAGATAAWPVVVRAQQALPVIALLANTLPNPAFQAAIRRGLSEAGFVEGKNIAIEYRSAEGHNDRLPALAADLVSRQVAVIVTSGNPSTKAAKDATDTIPIVFVTSADPVEIGLVVSLNRPGGNVTGATFLGAELVSKKLAFLHELVPTAKIIGLLVNSTNPANTAISIRDMQAAIRPLGLQLLVVQASNEHELDMAISALAQQRVEALVISPDAFFTSQSKQLGERTLRDAIPAIYQNRDFAAAGGLISYGANIAESYRIAGTYCGRILVGEKPANLPVQQSTKVELVINLKTASSLGIAVPLPLSGGADEIIE